MFNHVALLGRLAQEPELRYTQGGTPVVSFDLAVQVPSKDKDTPPDYIPIVCWREQAEFCERYLTKGRQVVVEGRISTRKYDGSDGKRHKVVEVKPPGSTSPTARSLAVAAMETDIQDNRKEAEPWLRTQKKAFCFITTTESTSPS